MNLINRILSRFQKPTIKVDEPSPANSDDVLYPDATPHTITRDDARNMIDVTYASLKPADKARILEDLYSRFEFDTPYARSYQNEKLGVPGTFTLLREWFWTERMDVLERAHQAWERNPLAKAGVSWTTRFAIGSGGTLTYKAQAVKEVLDEFINDPLNSFQSYEREFCDALQVDGEIFLRFFKSSNGYTTFRPIRPWHIQWITSNPQDYKDIQTYHYVYIIYQDQPGASQLGIEDVPADEILHVAINRLPYEMRGRPDLFAILPWLKAYRDWLEERARINCRKSVYYHVKLKNAQSGQVAAMQAKFRQPPPPGSIIVTNDNVEWIVLEANIRAGEASEDGRQIKMMALMGLQIPEYFTGDGAEANLATATAQALPALKKFSDYQDILADQVWAPLFKRVIANAVKAGRITGDPVPDKDDEVMLQMIDTNGNPVTDETTGEPKMIKSCDAFEYAYPQIEEKDPFNLAKALQVASGSGWISDETATSEMGYDYAKEQKNLEAEAAKRLERAMNTPRGFNPDGTPLPPKDQFVLNNNPNGNGASAAKEPNVTQSGGANAQIGTGKFNAPDRQLPPSEASPQYSGQ